MITAWSHSRLDLYETCPAQANYQINERLKSPQTDSQKRGLRVHENMEALVLKTPFPHPAEPPPAKINKFWPLIEEAQRGSPIVEQEWAFNSDMKPVQWFDKSAWFRAKLDVGLMPTAKYFTVIDWKTGKPFGSNAEQMEQFAMAVFGRYAYVQNVRTLLAYLDSGDEQEETFNRSQYQNLLAKWRARADIMFNDRTFTPRPGSHCKRCIAARSQGGPCAFG